MVPSSLFLVGHFQQQVTPTQLHNAICDRQLGFWGKLNQNPNTPPMPKLPECVGVSRGGALAVSCTPPTHTLSVPFIPQARTPILAPTFEKTLTPHQRNCGNPKSRATTMVAVDTRETVRTFGYPPTVYWPMSPVWNDLSELWNAACSVGLFGLRMDRWFGLRRWLTTIIISNGKTLERHPTWKCSPLIPQQKPKTRSEAAQLTTQSHEGTMARSETWAHFC